MIILSGFLFWKLKTLQEWHKVNISTLMFTLHQIDAKNHRMVQVVRELEDHLIPTLSAMGRVSKHQLRLRRLPSNLVLRPAEMGHPQLLWTSVSVCPHSIIKEFPPNI